MVDVQNCDVAAIPAPFRLSQQWIGIEKHCCVSLVHHMPSLAMLSSGLGFVSIADVTMETKASGLL
jgi:hypothetical protein